MRILKMAILMRMVYRWMRQQIVMHTLVAVANYKNDATYTIHFTLALISFVLLYFITYS